MHLDRLRAAGLAFALLGWSACQVVPQPSWSPDSDNSRASRVAPTPTAPRPKPTRSNRSSEDRRSTIQGGPRTISFEQDGEVYTVGWVYLPRTAKSYNVLHLTSQIPGTVQVEMLWDRSVDDFALEVEDSAGTMVKATRTGLKESTLVFLPRGRRASVYMTRFSSENIAPKLVMRFSAGSSIPSEPPQHITAEYRAAESTPTPDLRIAVLDLPRPPPEEQVESAPAPAPVSVEREPTARPPGWTSTRNKPSPISKPKSESDAPARKPAANTSRKPSEAAVRKTSAKPVPPPAAVPTARPRSATASGPAAPTSATMLPAVARATTPPTPTQQAGMAPTSGPGAGDAEVANDGQELPEEDESVQVGEPRKGAKISPRGEATHVDLSLNAGTFTGTEELVLEIPQARLEITVPRGFEVTVRDDRERSVTLTKVKLFESWEGIAGTDASFLSDSFSTPPLPSGHYVVRTHGRFEDVRLRTKSGVAADRDAVLKQSSKLVLIKRQNG